MFLDQLDQCLTPQVIRNINEAFCGKVVVVKRDLDHLYQKLIHRKYTLAQTSKIIEDWLTEETISGDTFLHFFGKWPNLFRVVREGALWANQPTDTPSQLSRFEQAFSLTYPEMDQEDLLLILFSDHGFVENPAFNPTDKYESPRYLHGKDSPFEVIIPWAWVMRL